MGLTNELLALMSQSFCTLQFKRKCIYDKIWIINFHIKETYLLWSSNFLIFFFKFNSIFLVFMVRQNSFSHHPLVHKVWVFKQNQFPLMEIPKSRRLKSAMQAKWNVCKKIDESIFFRKYIYSSWEKMMSQIMKEWI